MNAPKINPKDWDTFIEVLRHLVEEPDDALDELTLKTLVTKMYKDARKRNRKERAKNIREADNTLKAQTYIFQRNDEASTQDTLQIAPTNAGSYQKLQKAANCYICKQNFTDLHYFYHALCPKCAEFNHQKRLQTCDLSNRIVLLTGGRIKIGYELALRMLRDGATVIITTRFPNNAQEQYANEPDFAQWSERLHIFGLDFRNISNVNAFIDHIQKSFSHLDIIINNAAQTIKRPLAYYQELLDKEKENHLVLTHSKNPSIEQAYFPIGQKDKDQQQLDLRPQNSWMTPLSEVSTFEMLEVQLVNVTAPFLLNSRLKNMLLQSPFPQKFIINVSAMEGQFNKAYKSIYHPHTNMAKAALNMMTRTSAQDYAKDQIFMTSVDTGWITDENPYPKKMKMRKDGFITPLDCMDGAARVYDPIASVLNGASPTFGVFLKDYKIVDW